MTPCRNFLQPPVSCRRPDPRHFSPGRLLMGAMLLLWSFGLPAGTAALGATLGEDRFAADQVISAKTKIAGGVLKIQACNQGADWCPLLEGLNLPRFTVTLQVRQLKIPAADHFFGLVFDGANSKNLMVFTRGSAFGRYSWSDKFDEHIGEVAPLAVGPDAPWTELKIRIDGEYVEVNAAGKRVGDFSFPVAPVTKLRFFGNNLDLEAKELKVEPLAAAPAAPAAVATSTEPDLYAGFDQGLDAVRSGGQTAAPLAGSGGVNLVEGVKGQAVFVGRQPVKEGGKNVRPWLQYDAQDVFGGSGGTVSFWFRPNEDGGADKRWRFLFTGQAETEKKNPFSIWLWEWLRVDLPRRDLKPVTINRCLRGSFFKGDWFNLVLTWDAQGWTRLYVDGIPYRHEGRRDEQPQRFSDLNLDSLRQFCLGSGADLEVGRNADGAFDELKLYRRPLSETEVVRAYRQIMPLDLICDRSTLFAGREEKVVLSVAPGGYYARPAVGTDAPQPAKVELELELTADAGPVATQKFSLAVDSPCQVELPVGHLAPGVYRLRSVTRQGGAVVQKSFRISCYAPAAALPAEDADLRPGRTLFEKDFAAAPAAEVLSEGDCRHQDSPLGAYFQAGSNNGDRFGCEIEFPEEALTGRPVLLEVEWPDDRPRSMALYMYPEAKTEQHRERLEGGIQSGEEYPLTGKLQTTRHLFYPGVKRYLFEARTMVKDYPAAVRRLRILELENARLPKLKLELPAGLPGRQLGHLDEDQTVHVLLNSDDAREQGDPQRVEKVLDRWCDYFDYTGQNAIAYPILRYTYMYYPLAGHYGNGGFPQRSGTMPTFIEMFGARGMKFIGIDNLYTLPEQSVRPDRQDELQALNLIALDGQGKPATKGNHLQRPRPNLFNPEVRRMYLWHLGELIGRYGRLPGFTGVEIWAGRLVGQGLESGYNPQTVAAFAAAAGVQLPAGDSRQVEAFLTGPARAQWLRWRADQTTDLVREIAARMAEINPELKLYLGLGGEPTGGSNDADTATDLKVPEYYYENYALDLEGLKALPGVFLVPLRMSTDYRWEKHWARPEATTDESLYDFQVFAPFLKAGQAASDSYPRYFETFRKSLKQDVYKAYFQNADVKPFGRYFLKELVYPLAMMDSPRILIGAQPLGSWGREVEMREFARAYRALPAQPFALAAGGTDPVTVRYLNTPQGTYVYLVNLLWSEVTAELRLDAGAQLRDLSTGQTLPVGADGGVGITLLPYQLRSWLVAAPQARPVLAGCSVPPATLDVYKQRLAQLKTGLTVLQEVGGDVAAAAARFEAIEARLRAGQYADAHRLAFSKLMNTLLKQGENRTLLKSQAEMLARNEFAVKCGSYEFYRTQQGQVFFPDQRFNHKRYGYDGGHSSVARNISKIHDFPEPGLFATEAYDLDAYRFKVPAGLYDVKLYFKAGYEPGFKPGYFVFNVDLEGKRVLDRMDLVEACHKDFGAVLIKEFKAVPVEDGVLDIEFTVPAGVDSTARLCNAIEVQPAAGRAGP